jgi:hypothetical protein
LIALQQSLALYRYMTSVNLIIERAGHRFLFEKLPGPESWSGLDMTSPFGCLLWDGRPASARGDLSHLTRDLVAAGCETLACAGLNAEAWHDAADEEVALLNATSRSDLFVMTTWHTDESIAEVALYFTAQANVDDRAIRTHLVLYLGTDDTVAARLATAIHSEVAADSWDVSGSDAV